LFAIDSEERASLKPSQIAARTDLDAELKKSDCIRESLPGT
jgi:hypothetical protein